MIKNIQVRTLLFFIFFLVLVAESNAQTACPKPLFVDPTYNGSSDPEIIWNDYEQEWWIFYTGRRPAVKDGIFAGCALGVATSKDWIHWKFKGYCKIDGIGGLPDSPDTYWAPGIIKKGDTYHMFVTFKKGSPGLWGGSPTLIYHLTAPSNDLLNGWTTQGGLDTYPDGIDAGLFAKKDTFYLYHRDLDHKVENSGRSIKYMTSTNLKNWEYKGWAKGDINNEAVNGHNYQEAPYVFYWKNYYWLLTDPSGKGISVYRSDDCINWSFKGNILDVPGRQKTDANNGHHPSIAVVNNRAFIFYFVEPDAPMREQHRKENVFVAKDYYCYLQIAELEFRNGKLYCDRDKKVVPPKNLKPNGRYWGHNVH